MPYGTFVLLELKMALFKFTTLLLAHVQLIAQKNTFKEIYQLKLDMFLNILRFDFEILLSNWIIFLQVDFIVTNNAANMKKAFEAKFTVNEEECTVREKLAENVGGEQSIWEELDDEDASHVNTLLNRSSRQCILCFAHSLQLVVGDGLSDTRCINRVIFKLTKFALLLHCSTIFKQKCK